MEERWLVSIAPKKSDSGIYLSKIELFILRLPYIEQLIGIIYRATETEIGPGASGAKPPWVAR